MNPNAYCRQQAAQSGSSFYYSFLFLPVAQREAIMALYAFVGLLMMSLIQSVI
jgi:15-cis-phytoene synthase